MSGLFEGDDGNVVSMDAPMTMQGGTVKNSQPEGSFSVGIKVAKSAFDVLTLGLSQFDSDTKFSHPKKATMCMTPTRKTVLFPTLRLDFVKQLKNKAHVTVNDILLSAFTGAMRRLVS